MDYKKKWVLHVKSNIPKIVKKFSRTDRESIVDIIGLLAHDPYFGDIQKIKGQENVWRRRVGSYRIFYEVLPLVREVHVFHIERRNSKTY